MPANDPTDDDRPDYLLGQPFWLAEATSSAQRWQMAFHEQEPADDRTRLSSAFRPVEESGAESSLPGVWQRIGRDRLLELALSEVAADQPKDQHSKPWFRVGLVCGAGLGKTTALQWLESAINRMAYYRGKFLAFAHELETLPHGGEALLLRIETTIRSLLPYASPHLLVHLKRLRVAGRIVLLLDSLDQADPDPKGPAVAALRELFDGPWRGCRIWISGRPYAFRTAASALREKHPNADWQFVRVGQLDEPECRHLLETARRPGP